MNAIKPSWTRSPQPFAIRLKQSLAHKVAVAALSTTALALLIFSPLSTTAIISSALLIIGFTYHEWRTARATKLQVLCYSPSGTWSIYHDADCFHGQLGKHSYRSRWLSIVAIEHINNKTQYVIVFYDSVDKRSYSLLQLHLKFPV